MRLGYNVTSSPIGWAHTQNGRCVKYTVGSNQINPLCTNFVKHKIHLYFLSIINTEVGRAIKVLHRCLTTWWCKEPGISSAAKILVEYSVIKTTLVKFHINAQTKLTTKVRDRDLVTFIFKFIKRVGGTEEKWLREICYSVWVLISLIYRERTFPRHLDLSWDSEGVGGTSACTYMAIVNVFRYKWICHDSWSMWLSSTWAIRIFFILYWIGCYYRSVRKSFRLRNLYFCKIFSRPIEPYSHFDGLVQVRRNSFANALELRLSCTNPSPDLLRQHPPKI